MKKISCLVVCALVGILSFGCASKDENYNAWLDSVDKSQNSGKEQVVKYMEKGQAIDAKVLDSLAAKGNDTAIVLYGLITKERDAAIMNEFKVVLPEAPMTQNEAIVGGIKEGKEVLQTAARWGFGYMMVDKALGSNGLGGSTTINAKDNAKVNLEQNKVNTGGDGQLLSGDGNNASTNKETTTTTNAARGNLTQNSNNTGVKEEAPEEAVEEVLE